MVPVYQVTQPRPHCSACGADGDVTFTATDTEFHLSTRFKTNTDMMNAAYINLHGVREDYNIMHCGYQIKTSSFSSDRAGCFSLPKQEFFLSKLKASVT